MASERKLGLAKDACNIVNGSSLILEQNGKQAAGILDSVCGNSSVSDSSDDSLNSSGSDSIDIRLSDSATDSSSNDVDDSRLAANNSGSASGSTDGPENATVAFYDPADAKVLSGRHSNHRVRPEPVLWRAHCAHVRVHNGMQGDVPLGPVSRTDTTPGTR